MAHGSSNKAKARQSHKKAGYYKEQYFRTERNKARKKTKREARAAKWKAMKAAPVQTMTLLHKRAKRLVAAMRKTNKERNVYWLRKAFQLDRLTANHPQLEYLAVLE